MNLAETKAKIAGLFREDAVLIVDRVQKHPLVVVTGPFRMGKTRSLIPQIEEQARRSGMNPLFYDFLELESDLSFFQRKIQILSKELTSIEDNRLLIGDEGGRVTYLGASYVDQILATVQGLGSSLISVIAFKEGRVDARDRDTDVWLRAQYGDNPPSDTAIHLQTKYLPRQLAEELLHRGSDGSLTEEQIAEILQVLPPHPWILSDIAYNDGFPTAKSIIRNNAERWYLEGVIPDDRVVISHFYE